MWINGLDEIDNKIINILLENGRVSYSELGSIVGISRTSVKNRISELEEKGIISGYKAIVRSQDLPKMITFIVNIEIQAEHFSKAKSKFTEMDEIMTVCQTTGNCRLMLVCEATSIQDIKAFVNKVYKEIEGITSTTVHAVLEVLKGRIIQEK